MGSGNSPHVLTLVNSIIGVSILAMPYCYKQCGIVLASLFLILINFMTRLSCHYLLKSAIMIRRKNFEFLAFHAFGSSGKTLVELSIILLMIGTCIAFFVVMGDLGPSIIGSLLNIDYSEALRPAVLIGLAIFVVLPLGMLRNVDSLSYICTASFVFYLLLVLKVFFESTDNLLLGSWVEEVHYWRPSGILQCLPIFSMALSCQSQLFEVFQSVGSATLDRMNLIVKHAVNICTGLYIGVGFFGHIAYYKGNITGNVLMSFSESVFSEIIKLLFVLSVAVTFPLVIFPCRASVHSLLFKKAHMPHYELVTGGGNHIPEAQFKCITFFIITVSLIVGLLAPNIEIVLGLIGSTIGVVICLLFPPFLFIWISSKATTEKVLAQGMCMFGLFIMIVGTYANVYLTDSANISEAQAWKGIEPIVQNAKVAELNVPPKLEINNIKIPDDKIVKELDKKLEGVKPPLPEQKNSVKVEAENKNPAEEPKEDKRIEPPVPVAPEAVKAAVEMPSPDTKEIVPKPEAKIKETENIPKENPPLIAQPSDVKPKINDLKQSPVEKEPKVVKNIVPSKVEEKEVKPKDEEIAEKKVAKESNIQETPPKAQEKKSVGDEIPNVIKDKPPLPILINNANGKNDAAKEGEKANQRDILGNIKNIAEREKRDLYATDETLKQQNVVVNTNMDLGLKADVFNVDTKVNSFVKDVADSAKINQNCDNDKENGEKSPNKDTVEERKADGLDNGVKVKEREEPSVNDIPAKETKAEIKESIILAPKVLSNPNVLLGDKISVEGLKAVPADIKPIGTGRELKSADYKESDNKSKK